jgi:hypothetical protein
MKRILVFSVILIMCLNAVSGVVGHNGSGGDMEITSGAGATTGVGPDGQQYSAKVSSLGSSYNDTKDSIDSSSISSGKIMFNGTIRASTPCNKVTHEVEESENKYVLNIKTSAEENGSALCTQVITGFKYSAEFEASEPGFTLEVKHDGERIKQFQSVSDKGTGNKNNGDKQSFIHKILRFLGF